MYLFSVWLKLPPENWFPMGAQMCFKVNDHEFKVVNGVFVAPQKCKCNRIADIIMIKCHHIYSCHECMTGYKKKECEKCRQQFQTYEKIYLEPFIK